MAERSLEIYKVNLSRNFTFTKMVNNKWRGANEDELTDSQAFLRLYQQLLNALMGQGVWLSSQYKKKGLAVMSVEREFGNVELRQQNSILTAHSDNFVIEGYIDAGIYDMKRKMATYTDTSQKSVISKEKIITDSYYFYLYLRMNSRKGILMLESKKGIQMSGVFTEFISRNLGIPRKCSCKTEMFMPVAVKNQYIEDSVLASVTCTENLVSAVNQHGDEVDIPYKVTVKVEPVDKPALNMSDIIVNNIMQIGVKIGNTTRLLQVFGKKSGQMFNSEQKSLSSFVLGQPDIVPKYPLPDEMFDETNSILFREQVKNVCEDLLPLVQQEVYNVAPIAQEGI